MSDEEKEKKDKTKQVSWAGLLMALFAAVTSVGDGVRACNEREANQQEDVKADIARVDADKQLKNDTKAALTQLSDDLTLLHDEDYDDLNERLEEADKEIFKLRTLVEAQSLILEMRVGVDANFKERIIYEALENEAREESVDVDPPPDIDGMPEEFIEKAAEKVTEKKRKKKRDKRPAPKFEFEEPAPAYPQEQIQQVQQQMQQQLPPLPPMPKKK